MHTTLHRHHDVPRAARRAADAVRAAAGGCLIAVVA
jgi:hypothetical protein